MSRMASAPARRASAIWYGSTMKSLRRRGRPQAARASRRSSSDPPNQWGSVSTEHADAPASS